MARGALKGLKRTRPSPGEKVVVKGQLAQGSGDRNSQVGIVNAGGADLDSGDLVSWLNCECFFSLVLVGLLAALPFNLHTQELMQSPETYVNRAKEFSGEGSFDKAASLYERAVNTEETAERHDRLGDTLVLAKRNNEALWHFRRAADLYDNPRYKVSSLTSLGHVQAEEGQPGDAAETFLEILRLQEDEDPDEVAEAHFQVGLAMVDSQDHSEALKHFEKSTEMDPDLIEAREALAHTLRDMGSVEEAIRRYKVVTAQGSTDIFTLVQLGFAYHELCDFSQALAVYKKARSSPSKTVEMDYLTAALHSTPFRPARAPEAYVSDLFNLEARKNAFLMSKKGLAQAAKVDGRESTGALAGANKAGSNGGMFYDVHGLIFDSVSLNIRAMIEAALGLPADDAIPSTRKGMRWLDVLDLGCGRGTMGSQLRHLANYMTGVDLALEAMKVAKRAGMYDSLEHGDIATVTKSMLPSSFDLVVASDALPYFGDLGDLLQTIAAVTRNGGLVAFNVDALEDDDSSKGVNNSGNARAYELKFTGRWSHRRKYVTQSVTAAGMYVLGVRTVKGTTRLISPAAGEIVLEAIPQEQKSTIFLCEKSAVAVE